MTSRFILVITDYLPWISMHMVDSISMHADLCLLLNLYFMLITLIGTKMESQRIWGRMSLFIFKVIPLKLFYYQTFFETWRN